MSLAILAVMLYCGIFPAHPVTAAIGPAGVTMRVLGIAATMYAVNVLLLGVASRAGFLVEQPQPGIPDGYETSATGHTIVVVRICPSPMTGNPILLIGGGALMLRRNR